MAGGVSPTALPELRPPLVPGDLGSFGGNRVIRQLGLGGMGVVYEAIDSTLGRTIALKLMLPAQVASESGRRRFLREARASAAIRHENVVTIYHVGEDGGVPFLTMELLRGQPLSQLLDRPMALAEVVRIGREVARGLAAAHAIGVVHRDIKPENIWIEESTGRVRLLDFGLARLGAEIPVDPPTTPPPEQSAHGLTQVGAILGTPAYMAPEQARGETVDHKADLFSLGCVLYQMLTGTFPFRGQTIREQVQALTAGAYVPIDPSFGVPEDLADLVHRLLAAPPADRPATAAVVAEELLAISTRLMILAGTSTPMPFGQLSARGAPEFEFVDPPLPFHPPRRSQVPLLLGTILFVIIVTALLSTQRIHRISRRAVQAAESPRRVSVSPSPPRREWLPPGFTPLFTGTDLSGWHSAGNGRRDAWSVSEAVLTGTPRPHDQVLLTDREYEGFELRMEYRWLRPGGHTSILLRADEQTGIPINIGDDEGRFTRYHEIIGRENETGTIRYVTFDPPAASKPVGEWNTLRVVANGSRIEVELNGIAMPSADLALERELLAERPEYGRLRGSIGLVCHRGTIEYRHIAIRPLR